MIRNVIKLVSLTNKLSVKALACIKAHKEKLKNMVTRWNTGVKTVLFNNEPFEGIKGVVNDFHTASL